MADNNTNDEIHKYILKDLSEEEMAAFEEKMRVDPELHEEVLLQQKIAEGIEHFGELQFKSRVDQIYQEELEKGLPPINENRVGIAKNTMLFLLLGILVLLVMYFLFGRKSDISFAANSENLFAQFYEKYEYNYNLRNTENSTIDLDQAMSYYALDSFQLAKKILAQAVEKQPENIPLAITLVNCQLQIGETQAAIGQLLQMQSSDDVIYRDAVNWYLALAYVQQDDREKAQAILKEITNNSSSQYYQEAMKLMRLLSKK